MQIAYLVCAYHSPSYGTDLISIYDKVMEGFTRKLKKNLDTIQQVVVLLS
jgi:hypothetical protein